MLNKRDLKTLLLFSYYVKSHGVDECDISINIYDCEIEDEDIYGNWWAWTGTKIESYDTINELLLRIINNISLEDYFEECDGYGEVRINFDAKERKLKINGRKQVYGTNDLFTEYDKSSYEVYPDVVNFMDELKNDGVSRGEVTFEGGGDSGQLEGYLNAENANIDLPAGVEDFLYEQLSKFYGGWEINEGSHGSFIFYPEQERIELEFYEHTDDMVDVGQIYYLEF
jgi:hypothetical protein